MALRGIYAIVDAAEGDVLEQLEDVLAGGVRLIQYRAKAGIDRPTLIAARDRTHAAGALLIVNDELDLIDLCDGVHLGQEDLGLLDRRGLRSSYPGKVIGISTPDLSAAVEAERLGADYVGAGSIYATSSKADADAPIGPGGVRAIAAAIGIPVAAIGGITLERIAEVRSTGAAMAAVITAISRANDRRAAARALVAAWER